jgi:carbon-monoxide dehydrogenase large subunit
VEVDYEPLPVVVDPSRPWNRARAVPRTGKPGKKDNHIFHWEVGDRPAPTPLSGLRRRVKQRIYLPRIHGLHRDLRLRGVLGQGAGGRV